MKITDAEEAEISFVSFQLDAGGESAPFTIIVRPDAGEVLKASPSSSAASVLCRVLGSAGAFTNISAAPFNLSPWAEGRVSLEIKVAASAGVLGRVRVFFTVGTSKGTAAGWAA